MGVNRLTVPLSAKRPPRLMNPSPRAVARCRAASAHPAARATVHRLRSRHEAPAKEFSPRQRRMRPSAENLRGPRLSPPVRTNCGRDHVVSLGTSSVSGSPCDPPGPPPPGPSMESTTTSRGSGWNTTAPMRWPAPTDPAKDPPRKPPDRDGRNAIHRRQCVTRHDLYIIERPLGELFDPAGSRHRRSNSPRASPSRPQNDVWSPASLVRRSFVA